MPFVQIRTCCLGGEGSEFTYLHTNSAMKSKLLGLNFYVTSTNPNCKSILIPTPRGLRQVVTQKPMLRAEVHVRTLQVEIEKREAFREPQTPLK